jgi:hypothetical protein
MFNWQFWVPLYYLNSRIQLVDTVEQVKLFLMIQYIESINVISFLIGNFKMKEPSFILS